MIDTTVVVAAFNVERYLGGCLDSLLAQTAQSMEIVVVDDGSTDSTGRIADRYAARSRNIRVIHRTNGGLSVARNSGLEQARGQFVVFLDADDWADATLIEALTATAEATSADVVVAGCHVDTLNVSEKLVRSVRRLPPPLVLDSERRLSGSEVTDEVVSLLGYAWNKMYRRDLLLDNDLRFEPGLSLVEDVVFNAQTLTHASRITLISGAFVHYVQRPRETLGSRFYPDYFSLRVRAMRSVGQILSEWGVDDGCVARRMSRMAATAISSGVRSVAIRRDLDAVDGTEALRQLFMAPGAATVLGLAQGERPLRLRDRLLLGLVMRDRLRLALVLTRVSAQLQPLRGGNSAFRRLGCACVPMARIMRRRQTHGTHPCSAPATGDAANCQIVTSRATKA